MMCSNRSPFLEQTGKTPAKRLSRQEVRPAATWVAGALVLLLGCGRPDLCRGIWLAVEGPEHYALKFAHAGLLLSGTMHQFREGKLVAQWGFAGTRKGGEEIELLWGSNNSLTATMALDPDELRGRVYLADGTDELAQRQLFEPLGITTWEWGLGKTDGYPSLAGTLHLRPLDMAKLGQLVLDGGRWRGKRVVSEEWIAESTQPLVGTGREAQKYGYLWWRLDAPLKAGRYPVIVASGWGSQFIHVVPALEAVIVTTGGNHLNGKNYDIGGLLLRRLVPGVESRSRVAARSAVG